MANTETGAGTGGDAALGYEQARDELIDVVRRLEAGGATLEESLALWERGEELAGICRGWLAGARARLDAALAGDAEEGAESAGAGGGPGNGEETASEDRE
ncbi:MULTISPECIES: exodeoxyribonuclease VII small subunit [unclassified Streptomyces]|uniref:exodeoxyribonuclease VII small subunit n=1 Tax=unclassified Streptomyces TaxID=2593676 RepID=UPI0022B74CAF|nr:MULTISPECIES: exodeoxyribonuclease VII small subunit [unclassified Streptomyces]MCZ7416747.1 exodeoxyribonuclease VII small subunit [Streptomyces sp. WMMC897]MCZ7433443.1 exodeoxyribonuclease VII small subunit [Streptomyces sp. WMMC1477]